MAGRHRKLEERSLALHREIAQRIGRNPQLLAKVRERLGKDVSSGQFSISLTDAMQEWLDLLKSSSIEQVLEEYKPNLVSAHGLRPLGFHSGTNPFEK